MSRVSATRDAWRPHTRHDREAVLHELDAVLSSTHFCNSKRYPALLRYIVERTLAGEADLLKERTLGVEVFERPATYDTNADTVVRYTAGEVRKRLSLYYHEFGKHSEIQISLPAGSYVPEFLDCRDELEDAGAADSEQGVGVRHPGDARAGSSLADGLVLQDHALPRTVFAAGAAQSGRRRRWWPMGAVVLLALAAMGGWRYSVVHSRTELERFWAPVLHDQSAMTVCLGGSVFSQTHTSGVATATKDVDYPFVSMQSVTAVAQLSALLQRSGGLSTRLESAASAPLTDLRERPVILLGGYNNLWTLRLLSPLRFHFASLETAEAIDDGTRPDRRWQRDSTQPYSNADDYALVARFRDATTGNWVVALAGLGRNGTEAAALFATSDQYMKQLQERAGADIADKNVEVVLKVSVIDGKTGAPSILAVNVW